MFFSIVVPIYNVEAYLQQCIDSILGQTFTDYEVILVDDGSKDKSPKICDEYAQKDGRIQVIHKDNGGQALARNIGTKQARGQYLIYLDSDDYIAYDTFLEELYSKAITGFPDVICYKFRKYFDDTKEMKECNFSIPKFLESDNIANRIEKLTKNDAFYCAPWTKAIKLALIKNNDVQFANGLLSEDQDWYYNVLINASSLEGINKSYIVYRQRKNSTSNSWKIKNLTDTISIISDWKQKIELSSFSKEYKEALYNTLAKLYCNILIGYTRYDNPEKKKYYQLLSELSCLLKYNLNPRVKTFSKIYKMGGFRALMAGLNMVCMVK